MRVYTQVDTRLYTFYTNITVDSKGMYNLVNLHLEAKVIKKINLLFLCLIVSQMNISNYEDLTKCCSLLPDFPTRENKINIYTVNKYFSKFLYVGEFRINTQIIKDLF